MEVKEKTNIKQSTIAYEFDKNGKPTTDATKEEDKESSSDKKVETSDID
jgi:hypothetical protein